MFGAIAVIVSTNKVHKHGALKMMEIFIDGQPVLSVPDTAKRFGVSVKTIYVWLSEGQLRSVTHKKRRYVYLDTIEELEKVRNESG